MKSLLNSIIKYPFVFLAICVVIALSLHLTRIDFPPINSDEASFAYNAYSIATTGKDEYGSALPYRFKAFGENKLPVTIYTIAPFVGIFGLNEISSRLPFILIGIFAPILFYYLALSFFKNKTVGFIAAFLAAVSPWIQIMSRHIHENVIILLLTSIMLMYLIKLLKEYKLKYIIILAVLNGISLFTYHIGKVMSVYFFLVLLFIVFINTKRNTSRIIQSAFIFLIPIIIFGVTELLTPTNRVSNLFFFNNAGFTLAIEEERKEHDTRLLHNKVASSIQTLTHQYLSYFSPEFLVIKGDQNKRFGHEGISPITPVEYVLMLVGLYYLFRNKESYRYLLLSFLLVAPLSASIAWQSYSLTRSFTMIIPILLLVSYGGFNLIQDLKDKWKLIISLGIIGTYLYFLFFTWEYYFYHYPQKKDVQSSWQAGYKDLTQYIKENYDEYDTFYITRKLGQPYIFMLFYMQYPPEKYQPQARLTDLDEYGFGQVEKYDKFIFTFQNPSVTEEKAVYVGYPEDFNGSEIPENLIKKIKYGNEDVFWIYEKN